MFQTPHGLQNRRSFEIVVLIFTLIENLVEISSVHEVELTPLEQDIESFVFPMSFCLPAHAVFDAGSDVGSDLIFSNALEDLVKLAWV